MYTRVRSCAIRTIMRTVLVAAAASSFAIVQGWAYALPALPNGKRLELLTESWSRAGTGGTVWTSALVMCRWQARHAERIEGADILELGSGTGAAGLQAAGLGARRVCLSDGGPEEILELLRRNVARNRHKLPRATAVDVVPLRWGRDEPPAQKYDLVMGSDVCYQEEAREALCVTLSQVLRRSGGAARAVLAHEHRSKAGSLEAFLEAAAVHGLACTTLHVEEGMVNDALEARAYAYKVSVVEARLS